MDERMHALVIEDSDAMRNALARLLETFGFTVTGDGQESLKVLSTLDRVDLITVDWIMPVMGGLQFVTALRGGEIHSTVPVIIITAQREPDVEDLFLQAGVNEFVTKPVTTKVLVEKLKGLGLDIRGSGSYEGDRA